MLARAALALILVAACADPESASHAAPDAVGADAMGADAMGTDAGVVAPHDAIDAIDTTAPLSEICNNYLDDDGDGRIDCAQPTCASFAYCDREVEPPSPACGDGGVDPDEACDFGPGNAALPNRCRPDCTWPSCGDGVVDDATPAPGRADEACDGGPGCGPSCTWTETDCGPGVALRPVDAASLDAAPFINELRAGDVIRFIPTRTGRYQLRTDFIGHALDHGITVRRDTCDGTVVHAQHLGPAGGRWRFDAVAAVPLYVTIDASAHTSGTVDLELAALGALGPDEPCNPSYDECLDGTACLGTGDSHYLYDAFEHHRCEAPVAPEVLALSAWRRPIDGGFVVRFDLEGFDANFDVAQAAITLDDGGPTFHLDEALVAYDNYDPTLKKYFLGATLNVEEAPSSLAVTIIDSAGLAIDAETDVVERVDPPSPTDPRPPSIRHVSVSFVPPNGAILRANVIDRNDDLVSGRFAYPHWNHGPSLGGPVELQTIALIDSFDREYAVRAFVPQPPPRMWDDLGGIAFVAVDATGRESDPKGDNILERPPVVLAGEACDPRGFRAVCAPAIVCEPGLGDAGVCGDDAYTVVVAPDAAAPDARVIVEARGETYQVTVLAWATRGDDAPALLDQRVIVVDDAAWTLPPTMDERVDFEARALTYALPDGADMVLALSESFQLESSGRWPTSGERSTPPAVTLVSVGYPPASDDGAEHLDVTLRIKDHERDVVGAYYLCATERWLDLAASTWGQDDVELTLRLPIEAETYPRDYYNYCGLSVVDGAGGMSAPVHFSLSIPRGERCSTEPGAAPCVDAIACDESVCR